MLGAGYRWLADSRFSRPAATIHAALLAAGGLTAVFGLWTAADQITHLWKDHRG